jgi:hypothetical protein
VPRKFGDDGQALGERSREGQSPLDFQQGVELGAAAARLIHQSPDRQAHRERGRQ